MDLYGKLDPQRFPNMSLQMAAILGFVLEREYTTPPLADVLVWPAEQEGVGHSVHLGAAADLRANLSRLGMAAGLDQGGWAQFAAMVHLVDQGWGLCLWWPYNERVNPMLKAIAKSFGGRYKGAPYRNWVIPVGAKSAVLDQLDGIGAVREA